MRRMIQVGSKEEVELLLALFGSHAQPPQKKPRWIWSVQAISQTDC